MKRYWIWKNRLEILQCTLKLKEHLRKCLIQIVSKEEQSCLFHCSNHLHLIQKDAQRTTEGAVNCFFILCGCLCCQKHKSFSSYIRWRKFQTILTLINSCK